MEYIHTDLGCQGLKSKLAGSSFFVFFFVCVGVWVSLRPTNKLIDPLTDWLSV